MTSIWSKLVPGVRLLSNNPSRLPRLTSSIITFSFLCFLAAICMIKNLRYSACSMSQFAEGRAGMLVIQSLCFAVSGKGSKAPERLLRDNDLRGGAQQACAMLHLFWC